jgi:hypothetical protein
MPTNLPYSYATLSDSISALGSRLYDSTNQFWTAAELTSYIQEALQTFNSMTNFYRGEMTFNLTAGTFWYDLTQVPNSIIPYTVTQQTLVNRIQYHLLEPISSSYPLTWTGSSQFALSDVLNALQRRQDDMTGTTACTIKRSLISTPVTTSVPLSDDTIIDVRRVAWFPSTTSTGYQNKPLRQSDRFTENAFNTLYLQEAGVAPSNWLQNTQPPLSFTVDIVPPVPGYYDILTTNSGTPWSASGSAVINVPSDWTWVIKWGAMMDLMSKEGNAKDELRTQYCQQRYVEGLALLQDQPTLLNLRLQNVSLSVSAIRSGDDFNPAWQAKAPGSPQAGYVTSNLLAFTPVPDNGNYAITANVVQNMPIPTASTDYIQVSRDDYDAILDYAQHLAMFKVGGNEFAQTVDLYQRFQRKAAEYNSKIKEMGFFSLPQLDLSQIEERRNPRYLPETKPTNG